MDEVGGPDSGGSLPVSWDEARELVAIVLLVVAVMVAAAPGVIFIGTGSPFGFWDDVAFVLRNVGPTVGMLLLGSSVLVCTVPAADVVPALRRAVHLVAAVIAVLGVLAVILDLTSSSADESTAVWIRLGLVMRGSGPGSVLAATAAWLAWRVLPFPE